jgi:hypothetical protein
MLQFANRDDFVEQAVRDCMADAAPAAALRVYSARHELTDAAGSDRAAFLAFRLGLAES